MNKRGRIILYSFLSIFALVIISLIILSSSKISAESQKSIEINGKNIDFIKNDDKFRGYDEDTNTIYIKNNTEGDILSAKLNTEQDYHVSVGYQKVAQFTINSKSDIKKILNEFEFYDLKKNEKIEREIDIKYLTIQDIEIIDYKEECLIIPNGKNGTEICNQVESGSHIEKQEVWLSFDKDIKKNQEIIIGLFTDVQTGDKIEWIPTFSVLGTDIKIEEWATWTEDLNIGLLEYWTFEDVVGDNVTGSLGRKNLTLFNTPTALETGKIGKAMNFSQASAEFGATAGNLTTTGTNVTVSGWINLNRNTDYGGCFKIGKNVNTGDEKTCVLFSDILDLGDNWWLINCPNTYDVSNVTNKIGEWMMFTIVYDISAKTFALYINATLEAKITGLTNTITEGEFLLNKRYDAWYSDGAYDEIGIWNRTLTLAEITQLYNSGDGITYGVPISNANPEISILYPQDNQNFSTSSITFSTLPIDAEDSSGLIVWLYGNWTGTWHNNATNTSALNNTQTNFTVNGTPNGKWILGARVGDVNGSNVTNTTNYTITIDTIAPSITLPFYANNTIKKNTSTLTLNISIIDATTSPSACKIDINGTNQTYAVSNGWCNITDGFLTNLADGIRTIKIYANDTLNLFGINDSYSVNIDNTIPLISFISPTESDNANTSKNYIYMNLSVTETNIAYINYTLAYTNGTLVNQTNITELITSLNVSNLIDSSYNYYVNISDLAGNTNKTEIRTITIDATIPKISIIYPTNTSYNVGIERINYTKDETNIFSCWYTTDNGITNSSPDSTCSNFTGLTAIEGQNNWTIWINDTANNKNSSSVSFFQDTTPPVTNIYYPQNGTSSTSLSQTFVFNLTDTNQLKNSTLHIWDENGTKLTSDGVYTGEHFDTAGSGNIDSSGITQNNTYFWIADDTNDEVYQYYMNGTYTGEHFDTAGSGNIDSSGITQNNTYFWVTDYNDDEVYQYYMKIYTSSLSGTSDSTSWIYTFDEDGIYYYNAYTCDTANNCAFNSTNYSITIDTTAPVITAPENSTLTYLDELSVDFDATDSGIGINTTSWNVNDTSIFSINTTGGLTNSTILPAGNYFLNISVKDNIGNLQYQYYSVVVDKNIGGCNILFNETSSIIYPKGYVVWADCNSVSILYENGTAITNNSFRILSAGLYNYTLIRTDQLNYTNITDQEDFIINKSTPTASLTNDKDWTREYDGTNNSIGISENNTGDSDIVYTLWRNNTNKSSSDSIGAVGIYVYKINSSEGENYSATDDLDIETLTIQDTTPPIVNYLSPLNQSYATNSTTFTINTSELNEMSVCLYNLDGIGNLSLLSIEINTLGTPITTCEELQNISNNLTRDYYLANDINCSDTITWNDGAGFIPIGLPTASSFTGNFNGNGFIISNLYINGSNNVGHGLFRRIGGNVSDFGIINAIVQATSNVGILSGTSYISANISNVYTSGNVYGDDAVGGFIGSAQGNIINSYSTANVTEIINTDGLALGGFLGQLTDNSTVYYSYSTGFVNSLSYIAVGGFIGHCPTGGGEAQPRYNTSFWDVNTSGQEYSHNCYSSFEEGFIGEGKNTTEMKDIITFSNENWNISDTSSLNYEWGISSATNNNYPYLQIFEISSNIYSITNSSMTDGSHNVLYYCNDTYGNIGTNSTTFIIDTTAPAISSTNPDNNTNTSSDQNYSANINDTFGVKNSTLYIYHSNNTLANSSVFTFLEGVVSTSIGIVVELIDDIYTWFFEAFDWVGNKNITDNRTITIDKTIPLISYNPSSEENLSILNRTWILVNVSTSDTNIHSVRLSWQNDNETFDTISGSNYYENKSSLTDGNYSFYAWINDTANNKNFTGNRTITIDTIKPIIYLLNPIASETLIENVSISLNFSATDTTLINSCWFKVVDSSDNIEISNQTIAGCTNTTFDLPNSDSYNLTLYVNDTAGNMNLTYVFFKLSLEAPAVNLLQPSDEQWFNYENNIYLNFSATDYDGIDKCYLWTNFTGTWNLNETFTFITSGIQKYTKKNISEGSNIWNVNCTDNLGLSSFALNNNTINIDLTSPNVTFLSGNNTNIETSAFTFYYNISDDALIDSCSFTLRDSNGNLHNYNANTSMNCGNSNRTISVLSNGIYSITIFGNDKAGNSDSSMIIFTSAVPSGGGGLGGGVSITGLEKAENFSITTLNYKDQSDLILVKNSTKPRIQEFILVNKGLEPITVNIACNVDNSSKSSKGINMCNYIRFPQETFTIPPNQQEIIEGEAIIYTPEVAEINDEYYLNIVALSTSGNKFSKLSIKTRVTFLGVLFKWNYVPFQNNIPEEERISYPVAGVSIILSFIFFLTSLLTFRKYKMYNLGLFISFGIFFASFFASMFLL